MSHRHVIAERNRLQTTTPRAPIPAHVDEDPLEPGPEQGLVPQPGPASPGSLDGVLDGILRIGRIPSM
jgi:hypothetical protein